MVIWRISPFHTFHHLVPCAVRARTQSSHSQSVPIGAVLRHENRVRAATLASLLCGLTSISVIAAKQRCRKRLDVNTPDTKLLFPGALLIPTLEIVRFSAGLPHGKQPNQPNHGL